MENVMNNSDLRREIWSYLRKEPQLICMKCRKVCIWDKKVRKYYFIPNMTDVQKSAYCLICWNKLTRDIKRYKWASDVFSCFKG